MRDLIIDIGQSVAIGPVYGGSPLAGIPLAEVPFWRRGATVNFSAFEPLGPSGPNSRPEENPADDTPEAQWTANSSLKLWLRLRAAGYNGASVLIARGATSTGEWNPNIPNADSWPMVAEEIPQILAALTALYPGEPWRYTLHYQGGQAEATNEPGNPTPANNIATNLTGLHVGLAGLLSIPPSALFLWVTLPPLEQANGNHITATRAGLSSVAQLITDQSGLPMSDGTHLTMPGQHSLGDRRFESWHAQFSYLLPAQAVVTPYAPISYVSG